MAHGCESLSGPAPLKPSSCHGFYGHLVDSLVDSGAGRFVVWGPPGRVHLVNLASGVCFQFFAFLSHTGFLIVLSILSEIKPSAEK